MNCVPLRPMTLSPLPKVLPYTHKCTNLHANLKEIGDDTALPAALCFTPI